MLKPLKNILFATNLSKNCSIAFQFAASIATRFQATMIILHVFEKEPDYVSRRLKRLFTDKQWGDLLEQQKINANEAREILIAKRSSGKMIKDALEQFCQDAGIDDDSCGYHSREIVVTDGDIVKEIIAQARKYKADLIILGSRKGLLFDNKIGHTIKSVMRSAQIPVLVVPPDESVEPSDESES